MQCQQMEAGEEALGGQAPVAADGGAVVLHGGDEDLNEIDGSGSAKLIIPVGVKRLFGKHVDALRQSRTDKKARLRINSVVESTAVVLHDGDGGGGAGGVDGGVAGAQEAEYQGDINLKNIQNLLALIDQRGYERSAHQLQFHNAFIRATSRVIFRADWSRRESDIRKKYGWEKTPSEILISTPRRFGKVHGQPHTPYNTNACYNPTHSDPPRVL